MAEDPVALLRRHQTSPSTSCCSRDPAANAWATAATSRPATSQAGVKETMKSRTCSPDRSAENLQELHHHRRDTRTQFMS